MDLDSVRAELVRVQAELDRGLARARELQATIREAEAAEAAERHLDSLTATERDALAHAVAIRMGAGTGGIG
jgi:hypothetical protein